MEVKDTISGHSFQELLFLKSPSSSNCKACFTRSTVQNVDLHLYNQFFRKGNKGESKSFCCIFKVKVLVIVSRKYFFANVFCSIIIWHYFPVYDKNVDFALA